MELPGSRVMNSGGIIEERGWEGNYCGIRKIIWAEQKNPFELRFCRFARRGSAKRTHRRRNFPAKDGVRRRRLQCPAAAFITNCGPNQSAVALHQRQIGKQSQGPPSPEWSEPPCLWFRREATPIRRWIRHTPSSLAALLVEQFRTGTVAESACHRRVEPAMIGFAGYQQARTCQVRQ